MRMFTVAAASGQHVSVSVCLLAGPPVCVCVTSSGWNRGDSLRDNKIQIARRGV